MAGTEPRRSSGKDKSLVQSKRRLIPPGILFTPADASGHNSWNVAMRQTLDIYASVVVCKSLPGFPTRHDNVDFAIIRENTEGEYSGLEHQSFPGVVESLKVSTRAKAERIARFAFDFAIKNNRKVSDYASRGRRWSFCDVAGN